MTGAIDVAFVDRADVKLYIGPPPVSAIYTIYRSCLVELIQVSYLSPSSKIEIPLEIIKYVWFNNEVELGICYLGLA